MNVQKRREAKKRKARRAAKQKKFKDQKKQTTNWLKGAGTSLLIWAVVIVNLFFIASFVSKFWQGPKGNQITSTTDADLPNLDPMTPRIQVEVLNGCGVPKVASRVTEFLRNKGFDVVKVDNYESFKISETTVIDRRFNDKKNALQVAKELGVADRCVAPFINQDLMLDVSIIIGRDYNRLNAWK